MKIAVVTPYWREDAAKLARCHESVAGQSVACTHVVAVNGAGRSEGRTEAAGIGFINKRAELWWRMREALDPYADAPIALPPDAALKADLCAPRWKQTAGGIQIEAKDEIAKRIGRSPDLGDAVCLALISTPKVVARREPRREMTPVSWMGV